MKLVTAAQMRAIEGECVARGTSLATLMERAGGALARTVRELTPEGPVLVLAGPGNNGGDGVVAAAALEEAGLDVTVYTFRRSDTAPYAGQVLAAEDDGDGAELRRLVSAAGVTVDALLGIGQSRPVEGVLSNVVSVANDSRRPQSRALAADIPTGIDADSGKVLGTAFHADITLCMGFAKLGAVTYPGAELAGAVEVADVGIPLELGQELPHSFTDRAEAAHLLPARMPEANKGSSGRVLAVCGSRDFTGAPVLASVAAYRSGAGLVELAIPKEIKPTVGSHAIEPIFLPLPEVDGKLGPECIPALRSALPKAKSLIVGSGMGISTSTVALMRELLPLLRADDSPPAVIDADGLNALARIPEWQGESAQLVLTPHPGEMSRLTGLSISEIQADRVGVARRFAEKWGVTVVLKGARTVVASPGGEMAVNASGGPNLATAGTGDVLTGVIGGLLAQGMSPRDAARAGAFLHGHAGDLWRTEHGDVGMLASDLLALLPRARHSILQKQEGT